MRLFNTAYNYVQHTICRKHKKQISIKRNISAFFKPTLLVISVHSTYTYVTPNITFQNERKIGTRLKKSIHHTRI